MKEVTVQNTDQAELERTDIIRGGLQTLTKFQLAGLKSYSKLQSLVGDREGPLIVRGRALEDFEALTDVSGLLEWDEHFVKKDLYLEFLEFNRYTPDQKDPRYAIDDKGKKHDLLREAKYLFYAPDRVEVLLNKLLTMSATQSIGDVHDDDLARKPTIPKGGKAQPAEVVQEVQDGNQD